MIPPELLAYHGFDDQGNPRPWVWAWLAGCAALCGAPFAWVLLK